MLKKDNIKNFIDELYSKPPSKNYPTNNRTYNNNDENSSIGLADMIDYRISNNKDYRYIFFIIDKFSKHLWAIPLKNKSSQLVTNTFSKILRTFKRSLGKIESDRGAEFYNSIFQNFLKAKSIQHYSTFTDKGPSIAERVIRTVRNLLKEPVFEKRNANWISELPSVNKQYNITIHSSIKLTPIQASKKANEKEIFFNLKNNREVRKPKFNLGQLVRTGDTKKDFSKGVSRIWSYNLYTITEVIHDTLPSYRINFLPERYNEHLLRPTKPILEETNKVMKKLNLIQ